MEEIQEGVTTLIIIDDEIEELSEPEKRLFHEGLFLRFNDSWQKVTVNDLSGNRLEQLLQEMIEKKIEEVVIFSKVVIPFIEKFKIVTPFVKEGTTCHGHMHLSFF